MGTYIRLRCSRAEHDRWMRASRRAGKPFSDWARDVFDAQAKDR